MAMPSLVRLLRIVGLVRGIRAVVAIFAEQFGQFGIPVDVVGLAIRCRVRSRATGIDGGLRRITRFGRNAIRGLVTRQGRQQIRVRPFGITSVRPLGHRDHLPQAGGFTHALRA